MFTNLQKIPGKLRREVRKFIKILYRNSINEILVLQSDNITNRCKLNCTTGEIRGAKLITMLHVV